MFNLFSQSTIEQIQLWLILGILFFIPISPAAPNILGVLLIIIWFIEGRFAEKWIYLSSNPLFWLFGAYLLIYPLSLLWSDNLEWGLHIVERHMVYLLFPFLLTAMKQKDIKKYVYAFILGVSLTELISYGMWFGVLDIASASRGFPTPFYRHTEYNPILAWALFLLMSSFLFEKQKKLFKLVALFFIVSMTINMFITGGRGGQFTYLVIAFLVIWQFFSHYQMRLKGTVFSIIFVATVMMTAYFSSPVFEQRVNQGYDELMTFDKQKCAGSVGGRLCMYLNTVEMSVEQPIFGSGVGDFPQDYTSFVGPNASFKMVPAKGAGHSHPHNQFLYELGALGFVGLLILLSILLYQIKYAMKFNDEFSYHRFAFTIYIIVINSFDSLLLAHPTGLIFICFSAILFFHQNTSKGYHSGLN